MSRAEHFSLVEGGVAYRLWLRLRIAAPDMRLLPRRIVVVAAIAWVPLLVLASLEGNALGGVRLPFLRDVETYARFLVAMPLLLLAEAPVHRRLGEIIGKFRARRIIPLAEMPRFEGAVHSAVRMRDAVVPEVALLAVAFLLGPWVWRRDLVQPEDTWYASVDAGRVDLTWAGWWFIHLSAPMFQFLWLRWYFRLALWWRLAWTTSRIPLALRPLHPDRAGGLAFLGESINAFSWMLLAQSIVVAGLIATRVSMGVHAAVDYRAHVIVLIVLLAAVAVVPTLFFAPQLMRARREGMDRFEALADGYVEAFQAKWLDTPSPPPRPPAANADLQSLADLARSNALARDMRPVPFELRTLVFLLIGLALPFLPLALTVVPLDELIRDLLEMLL